jgi:Fe-S cluster assembly protein SufD
MNAEARVRTPVEQSFAAAIEAAQPRPPGKGAVARLRAEAAQAFLQGGLPHRRIEEWKYTDLRAVMREAVPLASPPDTKAIAAARKFDPLSGVDAHRIVLMNGSFVAELSDVAKLEPGLTIRPLAQALAKGDGLARIGTLVPDSYDAVLALNTALFNDGAIIEIAPKTNIERPIHILHVFAGDAPVATFTRVAVTAGEGASATVIQSFVGPDGVPYQSNHAIEMHVGARATLGYVRLQAEGDRALHLATTLAEIGAGTRIKTCALTTGAALARNSMTLRFKGEGAEAMLAGATLLRRRQHADTTLVVDHALPGGTSRELFKSALDDESRGVFQGRIVVKPGAQKTDARMLTGALLLGEAAEADNKPELEIFADDVQCGHGATAGALDENLLFYLRARGIPKKEAEALMVESFVGEALETITHEGVRETLASRARAWLAARR